MGGFTTWCHRANLGGEAEAIKPVRMVDVMNDQELGEDVQFVLNDSRLFWGERHYDETIVFSMRLV